MKLFITGATGVLGRRVVAGLLAQNHEVVGLSRSAKNQELLANLGAEARQGDIFDAAQMKSLSADCEGIIHLATAIPVESKFRKRDWLLNDRLRTEGTRNLLDAALTNGHQLYIQESVCFIYGDQQGRPLTEEAPIADDLLFSVQSSVPMEQMVADAHTQGLSTINLRFGNFYGPDAGHTQMMVDMIKKRKMPVTGDGQYKWSMIHVDDAASAVVQAVTHRAGNGGKTFNICEDEPAPFGDMMDHLAELVGKKRPMRIPFWLAALALGRAPARFLTTSLNCVNDLAKERLHWQPAYPSFREGAKTLV